MAQRDLHSALKTEIVGTAADGGVDYKLVRLQSSKDDITYSLHAYPSGFSLSGIQREGLLGHLGFKIGSCAFFPQGKCLARAVSAEFPLADFAMAFSSAYATLGDTERQLEACCFRLDGAGHSRHSGDGHTSPQSKEMKRSEDEHFIFIMSWIEGDSDKGWTIHYRPKHPPLSPEIQAAFNFLELGSFEDCPYFDFEQCYYRFFPFEKGGHSYIDSNANYVHGCFDKHSEKFSAGLENLLKVHSLLEPFDMYFLPNLKPNQPSTSPLPPRTQNVINTRGTSSKRQHDFDVAISFAGTERVYAEQLASKVRDAGFQVFYDDFYPEQLWGKDLLVFFESIYRKQSKFCVIFISNEYNERLWTNHERKSAQARALEEKGNEYILPIKVDGSELPGMPPTIGYLSLREHGIDKIAELLIAKLKS